MGKRRVYRRAAEVAERRGGGDVGDWRLRENIRF